MIPLRLRGSWLTLARSIAAASLLLIAVAGPAEAASPPPTEAGPPTDPNIQAWIDEPLTPDAAAGAHIPIGITIWDDARKQLFEINQLDVVVRPRSGSAKPTQAAARSDWGGHLTTEIVVPRGGIGKIEIGYTDTWCTPEGACRQALYPFTFGGYGPPRGIPQSLLVTAAIASPTGPIPAGGALDVVVNVIPKANWDPAKIGLPDTLIVVARSTSRPTETSATIDVSHDPRDDNGATYSGQIQIPDPGAYRVTIAIAGNGTEDQVIASISRLTVTGGDEPSPSARPPTDAPTPTAPAAPSPPWLLILAGVAGVVAAAVAIRVAFADL